MRNNKKMSFYPKCLLTMDLRIPSKTMCDTKELEDKMEEKLNIN